MFQHSMKSHPPSLFVPIEATHKDWQPDHSATCCLACKKAFGGFIRKHHCRGCGHIFCDSCAPLRSNKIRSCSDCFEWILKNQVDAIEATHKDWQPDHSATCCLACKKAFAFFIRKHHCRACGHIFCDSCAPLRSNKIRSCSACFQWILKNQVDAAEFQKAIRSAYQRNLYAQIDPNFILSPQFTNPALKQKILGQKILMEIGSFFYPKIMSHQKGLCAGINTVFLRYFLNHQTNDFYKTIHYLCSFWETLSLHAKKSLREMRDLFLFTYKESSGQEICRRLCIAPGDYIIYQRFLKTLDLFFHDVLVRQFSEENTVPEAFRIKESHDAEADFERTQNTLNFGCSPENSEAIPFYLRSAATPFSGDPERLIIFLNSLKESFDSQVHHNLVGFELSAFISPWQGHSTSLAYTRTYKNDHEFSSSLHFMDPNDLEPQAIDLPINEIASQIEKADCFSQGVRITFEIVAIVKIKNAPHLHIASRKADYDIEVSMRRLVNKFQEEAYQEI